MKNIFKITGLLILLLFVVLNQCGENYAKYSIVQSGTLKVNILRYFLPQYWNYSRINHNSARLSLIANDSIIRQWSIINNDSLCLYYLQPDEDIVALDWYTFFLENKNGFLEKIEIDMVIHPDSTSYIKIKKYSGLEIKTMQGSIKTPIEAIHERGNSLMKQLFNGQDNSKVSISKNEIITCANKEDMVKIINKDFAF